jgi:hypothetical protein
MNYILNKGTFMIPVVPTKFENLSDVQKVLTQFQQHLSDIGNSVNLYDPSNYLDGGFPSSVYGGTDTVDGGGV